MKGQDPDAPDEDEEDDEEQKGTSMDATRTRKARICSTELRAEPNLTA